MCNLFLQFTILYFNNYYKEKNVKYFCHSRQFLDKNVNCTHSKAKPLLTVCVIKRQHKIHQKSPSSADTRKVNQRMPKGLQPLRAAGLFCFVFYLSPMSALLPQAPPVNAYAFSTRQTYSKFFSLNGHSSTTTQPRHSGLRALQILRPCQINQ